MVGVKNIEYKGGALAISGLLLTKCCCILPLFGSVLGSSIIFSQIKYLSSTLYIFSIFILVFSWYRFLRANVCHCDKRLRKRNRLVVSTTIIAAMIILNSNSFPDNFYTKEKSEIKISITECKYVK